MGIACAPSVDVPPAPDLEPLLAAYENPNVNVRAEIMRAWADDIEDVFDLKDALRDHKPGDEVEVMVIRNGERIRLTVTLSGG